MNFFLGYSERKIGNEYIKKQKCSQLLETGGIEAVKKRTGENKT